MPIDNPFEAILSELAELRAEVRNIKIPQIPVPPPKKLTKTQVQLLAEENGLPIKDGQLYFLSSTGGIPCERIGKRLIFDRDEILNWIESKKVQRVPQKTEAAQLLANSANKKLRANMLQKA